MGKIKETSLGNAYERAIHPQRRGVSLFNETIRHIRISVALAAPNIWNVTVEEVRRSLQSIQRGHEKPEAGLPRTRDKAC
jgi:hypothetical protein